MFYSIVTSLILFCILVYAFVQLARQERRNNLLERENEKMRSHNRYLVARYGIQEAAENPTAKHLRVEPIEKAKVIKQVVPLEEIYTDGIAYPEQWKDRELKWNRNTQR